MPTDTPGFRPWADAITGPWKTGGGGPPWKTVTSVSHVLNLKYFPLGSGAEQKSLARGIDSGAPGAKLALKPWKWLRWGPGWSPKELDSETEMSVHGIYGRSRVQGCSWHHSYWGVKEAGLGQGASQAAMQSPQSPQPTPQGVLEPAGSPPLRDMQG